ncbi:hypothetical protein BM221_002137 [Beauveria bassiana]|uniref:Uncharacterized protein n=1 Tax=Beauveria bassiana TaxID=176275 RepID=A0A2N6NXQ4_BEABA|nr:hypothetical protein BM221_002137 [Beauveria bassiana]
MISVIDHDRVKPVTETYVALSEAEAAAAGAYGAVGLALFSVGEAARFEVGHGLNGDGVDAGDGHGDGEDGSENFHFWIGVGVLRGDEDDIIKLSVLLLQEMCFQTPDMLSSLYL